MATGVRGGGHLGWRYGVSEGIGMNRASHLAAFFFTGLISPTLHVLPILDHIV